MLISGDALRGKHGSGRLAKPGTSSEHGDGINAVNYNQYLDIVQSDQNFVPIIVKIVFVEKEFAGDGQA